MQRVKGYFMAPVGMGMSELKMSHWIFQAPLIFFDTFIHLPWSTCVPSAPRISYVPVPEPQSPLVSAEVTVILTLATPCSLLDLSCARMPSLP